jgi:hypothetical protein
MQLLWFHLLPRTGLPEGFRDRHPVVRAGIHPPPFDPATSGPEP